MQNATSSELHEMCSLSIHPTETNREMCKEYQFLSGMSTVQSHGPQLPKVAESWA